MWCDFRLPKCASSATREAVSAECDTLAVVDAWLGLSVLPVPPSIAVGDAEDDDTSDEEAVEDGVERVDDVIGA